jgi:hypothetical protein
MEIEVSQEIIDIVCNSLRCSKQSLIRQAVQAKDKNQHAIIIQQLAEVKEALSVFQQLES